MPDPPRSRFRQAKRASMKKFLTRVRTVDGILAASPVIEASISTAQGNLLIFVVDLLGDRSMRTSESAYVRYGGVGWEWI